MLGSRFLLLSVASVRSPGEGWGAPRAAGFWLGCKQSRVLCLTVRHGQSLPFPGTSGLLRFSTVTETGLAVKR